MVLELLITALILASAYLLWRDVARERIFRAALRARPCAGVEWYRAHRAKPAAIRAFLHLVVDAWALPPELALRLRPDDRVDVLHAWRNQGAVMDWLEIESLSVALVERHGVRVETWDGVTLGALFDLVCANLGER